MENNFPLSAQIGLLPEHLKEEAGEIYVTGFKTGNPHHHHYQLLCILHLKFKLSYY
jgi:hypothetical protein